MSNDDERQREGLLPDYTIFAVEVASLLLGAPAVSLLLGGAASLGLTKVRQTRAREFEWNVKARIEQLESNHDALRDRIERDAERRFELLEIGTEAAVRAAWDERREYIAEIVARGLTSEERTADQTKKLLYLLNGLTDEEVIWLVHIAEENALGEGGTEHRRRHAETLKFGSRQSDAPRSEREQAALYDGYMRSLERAGLIEVPAIRPTGSTKPIRVTGLARMLLEYMGVREW